MEGKLNGLDDQIVIWYVGYFGPHILMIEAVYFLKVVENINHVKIKLNLLYMGSLIWLQNKFNLEGTYYNTKAKSIYIPNFLSKILDEVSKYGC